MFIGFCGLERYFTGVLGAFGSLIRKKFGVRLTWKKWADGSCRGKAIKYFFCLFCRLSARAGKMNLKVLIFLEVVANQNPRQGPTCVQVRCLRGLRCVQLDSGSQVLCTKQTACHIAQTQTIRPPSLQALCQSNHHCSCRVRGSATPIYGC